MKKTGVIVAIVIALVLGCGILFVTCNSNKGPDFNSLEGTYYYYTADGYTANDRIEIKNGKFTIYWNSIFGTAIPSHGTYEKIGEGTYHNMTGMMISISIEDWDYTGIMSNGKFYFNGMSNYVFSEDEIIGLYIKKGVEKNLKHWGRYYLWSEENGYSSDDFIRIADGCYGNYHRSSFGYRKKYSYVIDGNSITFKNYDKEIYGYMENDTIIISDDEIYKKSPYV